MKNEYWIFCKTKKCHELVIDIYDPNYLQQSREERFSELKTLLLHNIMEVKNVYVQWEGMGCLIELKKSWCGIERIAEIHQLIEKAYTQLRLTPWYDKNPVFAAGTLVLDEECDNSHIPHYKKVKPKRRKS